MRNCKSILVLRVYKRNEELRGTKVCGLFCAPERLSKALRVNNVEVSFVENKAKENEDVFYVCRSSTSGGRLLT